MPRAGIVRGMSDEQQENELVNIDAHGPSDVTEPVTEVRHYENNVEAYDDKAAEALKAQTAPNPTTDLDEARKAYGDDWNERRAPKIIGHTARGVAVYAGPPPAKGGETDRQASERYPLTAEARQRAADDES